MPSPRFSHNLAITPQLASAETSWEYRSLLRESCSTSNQQGRRSNRALQTSFRITIRCHLKLRNSYDTAIVTAMHKTLRARAAQSRLAECLSEGSNRCAGVELVLQLHEVLQSP